LPLDVPVGTTTTICVAFQLVMVVAVVFPNFTVLDPCVEPKFDPAIVTDVPIVPEFGLSEEMLGAASAANGVNRTARSASACLICELHILHETSVSKSLSKGR
jgi:hypothetical protein